MTPTARISAISDRRSAGLSGRVRAVILRKLEKKCGLSSSNNGLACSVAPGRTRSETKEKQICAKAAVRSVQSAVSGKIRAADSLLNKLLKSFTTRGLCALA
jgi:hypothetical protein